MIDDMFIKYFEEREGVETLKGEHGFIQYLMNEEVCKITDFYVIPECRRNGHGYRMADVIKKIAIANKCKFLTSQVDVKAGGASESVMTIFNYGFKILDITNGDIINFYMEL